MEQDLTREKHEWLHSGVTTEKELLRKTTASLIEPVQFPCLCTAASIFRNYSGLGKEIHMPDGIVVEFANAEKGREIPTNHAFEFATRILTFLESIQSSSPEDKTNKPVAFGGMFPTREAYVEIQNSPNSVNVVAWGSIPDTVDVKRLIDEVSRRLDEIINIAERSNTPDDQRILTELERAQLIALLKTTLALLEAPMIEKGLLQTSKAWLYDTSKRALKKRSEKALGQMGGEAVSLIQELLSKIDWPL